MSKANQNTADCAFRIVHHKRPDSLMVKNGLFRHIVANEQGRLVCVKLYANGWSITTMAGTMKMNVRLNGTDVEIEPKGNIRSGSLKLSEYVPIAKPQRAEKVLVDSIYGQTLTLKDIRMALESVYRPNSRKPAFDIIGFDACLMSCLEVTNALDGFADY